MNEWSFFCTPYNREHVELFTPKGPGVYLIWILTGMGRWECFYIGKADNLNSKLLSHLSSSEPNACLQELRKYICGFQWMKIFSGTYRDGAENYLYDALNPICNIRDSGGAALWIPLPPPPAEYGDFASPISPPEE